MKPFVVILLSFAFFAGCATSTIGHDFNAANIPMLHVDKTTLAEAKSLLGQPYQYVTRKDGTMVYIWHYIRSDATFGKLSTQAKDAKLIFNQDDVFIGILGLYGIALQPEDRQRLRVTSEVMP